MNKEMILFETLLKEAYEKGQNEQISVHEIIEELANKLRVMLGDEQ